MNTQKSIGSFRKLASLVAVAGGWALLSLPAEAKNCQSHSSSSGSNSLELRAETMPAQTPTETMPAQTPTETMPAQTETMPAQTETMPAQTETMPAQTETMPSAMSPASIVDIASTNDSFKTLTAALKAAGLVDTLAGKGPFTVFAPTDAAFAALPEGTLEMLLKPENKDKLVQILTYHVVSGSVKSTALEAGDVETVEGSAFTVKMSDGKVMVNQAEVVKADIEASNGVIHVIDKVIMPPDM